MALRVFAVAAHPDDIEFGMGGTLVLLAEAGCEIHYMTVGDGCRGTAEHEEDEIAAIRAQESQEAAACIHATYHPPLVKDLEIYYEREQLARLTAVVRQVAPDVVLAQSPQDYMEDHTNCCRLTVSAAFCRGMRNCPTVPATPPVERDVTVYHAQPQGNRDPLNQPVQPHFYVDITGVIDAKERMLACHRSQKEWLDVSQGVDSYLHAMRDWARELGTWSGRCEYAEGWRRHNPLGLCAPDADPLSELLRSHILESEAPPG